MSSTTCLFTFSIQGNSKVHLREVAIHQRTPTTQTHILISPTAEVESTTDSSLPSPIQGYTVISPFLPPSHPHHHHCHHLLSGQRFGLSPFLTSTSRHPACNFNTDKSGQLRTTINALNKANTPSPPPHNTFQSQNLFKMTESGQFTSIDMFSSSTLIQTPSYTSQGEKKNDVWRATKEPHIRVAQHPKYFLWDSNSRIRWIHTNQYLHVLYILLKEKKKVLLKESYIPIFSNKLLNKITSRKEKKIKNLVIHTTKQEKQR